MERLSVGRGDIVNERYLGFCDSSRYSAGMSGNATDVRTGKLTTEDKQNVAEAFALGANTVTVAVLPLKQNGLTMNKLICLGSSAYEEGVGKFKACHQRCLDIARGQIDTGDAQCMLLECFAAGGRTSAFGPF